MAVGARAPGHAPTAQSSGSRPECRKAFRRPPADRTGATSPPQTVIIWVAAVTGAVLIAGTIAIVIAKYNGKLNGL
ncbi:hypothetical protein ACIQ8G_26915 [Streptomyces sp. NPDC094154]|uniref:hypothetical protein n=1 Tax=Streptomyces sp. NPDC094154 TaxID=3366059 RepID=UPI00382465A0